MTEELFTKPNKPTSERQQLMARKALLNDTIVELNKEKVDILTDLVKIDLRLQEIKEENK